MVGTLVRLTRELGIETIAEGIECEEEHEYCKDVGFDYAQGYYFGKPAGSRIYTHPRWGG